MPDTLPPAPGLDPSTSETSTTCPYCGVGCGVKARLSEDGAVSVSGDPEHPANFGRLCSKGTNLGETVGLEERLLYPEVTNSQGALARASWDTALDRVASAFSQAITEHGPDSVAFYVSGQLLTEDYYVANKLMKGYIGSANIDTNSRLCMASSVAGHKRAFGSDTVPGLYEDLEQADLVVLVGSNLAWCHPVLYQRLQAARAARGTQVIVIDPRRTATAETADLHLQIEPGADVALFNGLLHWLADKGCIDQAFIGNHTSGWEDALDTVETANLQTVAARTGLRMADLAAFYDAFSRKERAVTVYSQGVNQSSAGTDKVNAILNCHLATGRIGRPGMGPFSVTGQPNAMGGRETGGLANQLACHLELENPGHRSLVQGFWQSPGMATRSGLKAVDLFDAIEQGRIKALWVMATNPAVSLPDADRVRDAIASCPFVAVSDVTRRTDTAEYADVLLPALGWGEKDGTVTNSERRISRQRAFLPAPGEAKADWWIISEVAKRLGFDDGFDYANPAGIFREYAALTAFQNDGSRDLDLGGFADVSDAAYDALEPTLWPKPSSGSGRQRFFADGGFFTPDGRARFIATQDRQPASAPDGDHPFILNSGRIRDQWHTMTRTGLSPQLSQHLSEPFVEVAEEDAASLGLAPASIAEITSPHGRCLMRVLISDRVKPGQVFVPMHWNGQWASQARIDALIAPNVDPVSGQPEAKFMPVRLQPYAAKWYAFATAVDQPREIDAAYWALARAGEGWRLELAGIDTPDDGAKDWETWARRLLGLGTTEEDEGLQVIASHDGTQGTFRLAAFQDSRLIGTVAVAAEPVAVARGWLVSKIGVPIPGGEERMAVLAGRSGEAIPDAGAIVCSCLSVGINDIRRAIIGQGCGTVEKVGACTGAGTNCGSCRPEIEVLIRHAAFKKAG